MKMKTYISLFLALALLACALAGCGGTSAVSNEMQAADRAPMAEAPMEEMSDSSLGSTADGGSSAAPENRKWIVTVRMSAETEDLDAATAALDKQIAALNGYVEDQHIYNGSTYSSSRYRNADLTIRIPAEAVDDFTREISGIANVISQEKNLEDVTLSYVATESRMNALKTEEARLLDFMEQAQTMADLLEIEARLTDVRYELERVTSQLRTYDNKINYATVYLDLSEVREYTPVEEPTLWERLSGGFVNSLAELWGSLQDLLVLLVISFPFLLVYGGITWGVIAVIRRIRKKKGLPKMKKQQKETNLPWQNPGDNNTGKPQ